MPENSPLEPAFFRRPTLEVTHDLMGQYLCRRVGDHVVRMPVTEAEAYDGFEDKASHAHRGPTPRNSAMFGEGGVWYVYLCYGVHWMLNIVAGEEGYPAAILIRGVGDINGPGRLTKRLAIDKSLDRQKSAPETGLWLERNPDEIDPAEIIRSPRIGIAYAGPEWTQVPYRFNWQPPTATKSKSAKRSPE